MTIKINDIKQADLQMIDQQPGNTTWDDVSYKMTVRRSIDLGLQESKAENGKDNASVRAEFGLME